MSGYCPDCGNVICLCKELLEEQLNNSKLFHCPNFTTNSSGYVTCDLDKHKLLLELEALRKERDVCREILTNIIEDLKGDFDLYRTAIHIEDELNSRLAKLKHSQSSEDNNGKSINA